MPDLVCQLLPGLAAAASGNTDTAYIFRPVALNKVAHHPDGVLWPRHLPGSSEALPVVILEVQMHADRRFHRRLAAETFRLLQWHEEVWTSPGSMDRSPGRLLNPESSGSCQSTLLALERSLH